MQAVFKCNRENRPKKIVCSYLFKSQTVVRYRTVKRNESKEILSKLKRTQNCQFLEVLPYLYDKHEVKKLWNIENKMAGGTDLNIAYSK